MAVSVRSRNYRRKREKREKLLEVVTTVEEMDLIEQVTPSDVIYSPF